MAKPYKRKDSNYWWIAPTIDGIQVHQSSKTTDYQEAANLQKRLEGKVADGLISVQSHKVTIADLCELHLRDMEESDRSSIEDVRRSIRLHIEPALGDLRASSWNGDTRSQYVQKRKKEGAANATINRELAAIKAGFYLGQTSNVVVVVPPIKMLPEKNVRQGFFRDDHFRAVLKHASPLLADILIVAFYTGWRIKSILNLEWDIQEPDVARSKQTKNEMATVFPLEPFPELRSVFDRRRQDAKGLITPWVFHREGKPVRSIRTAWDIARRKANVPGRIIHDFRRTAVRNLKTAGWSDTEIMQMVGLKTLSMLLRYGITVEADILKKAATMASCTKNG